MISKPKLYTLHYDSSQDKNEKNGYHDEVLQNSAHCKGYDHDDQTKRHLLEMSVQDVP
jgi:hypothetical protein